MQFVVPGKNHRRNDRDEQSAQCAPGGDHQIKSGQMPRVGPEPVQFAVTDHAADEHSASMHRYQLPDGPGVSSEDCPADAA
jgi:hypothetical protein